MGSSYNVYCDESCHLENDSQSVMVLGAVWCPLEKTKEISVRLREIKERHLLGNTFETKWSKVSPSKNQFYLDTLDYFFDDDDLHFRGVIASKSALNHGAYAQDHDDWYYKMYFTLIKVILEPNSHYRIYVDIKDTQGAEKVRKLHNVLSNSMFDFSHQVVEKIQTVRSHEIELLQLADLLAGVISYVNRGLSSSTAKQALVARMKQRSNYDLKRTTLYRENKVNLLHWTGK